MSLSCPLCVFDPPVRLFAHRDFPGSAIYECRRCALLFTSPLPDLDTLAEYYQEKYPLPGLGVAGTTMLANKYQSLAEGQYQFVMDWYPARRTARDLQVLEVGCGPGFRLVSCGPRVEEFYRPRPSLWRRGLRRLGLISSLPQPVWDWNRTYAESLMVGKNLRALLVKDSGGAA